MTESQGIIGTVVEDGFPVIYRYVDDEPTVEKRAALPWLTVVSWSYDRDARNGMPPEAVNARMVELEDALSSDVEVPGSCEHAVSKTGNGLKELIYYVDDRDTFIERLNAAIDGRPRYPIEITFYHDPDWQELQNARELFDGVEGTEVSG